MTKPDFTPDVYSMKMKISRLEQQLAKANGRVEELEEEVVTVKRTYNQLFDEMLKEQERNRELSQNQLLTESGKNRYGLDVSYFRNVINRELNKPLVNHKPDELARVFARLSRTADESVMFEPEFSNKFAIEHKIEVLRELLKRKSHKNVHDLIEIVIDSYKNQLRKEQEK